MRIKRMFALTALFMLIAAFTFSLTVFAEPVDATTAPPAPAVPAAPATDTVQTPQPTEAPAPTPTLSPNALTPNGQASVLNYYQSESDDKEFYTITTPAGNVFYLVIDGARGSENVYFLNAVTESDLIALAAENDKITISSIPSAQTCNCSDKCTSGHINTDCPVCKNDVSKCIGGSGSAKPSTDDEAESGSGGKSEKGGDNSMMMYIIIGAAFVLVAGIGIYAKIIKPKKQGASFDEDDESEDYGGSYDDEHYGSPEYLPEDDYDENE